mmetsp:Transcript_43994/g.42582  ORF Transcript_43994/g.42582 Transcript_43994/m.42582 type:complete len:106 (+) Transcript_43994:222-539(+)
MNINLASASTDVNALLRSIAVTFPNQVTWKSKRSYMLGEVKKLTEGELEVEGYIRQNYLNAKRLIHITGKYPINFKIKKIELAKDLCPVKISQKEKDKVLSTSKA